LFGFQIAEQEIVHQLANEDGLLEMEPVPSILHHDDVIIGDARERVPVELSVVDDLALERLSSIQKEARPIIGAFELGKAINVFLVVGDGLQVNLECAISVQVEK